MAIVLALPKLYSEVSALLVGEVPGVRIAFGWREPGKHLDGGATARVTFVPGDGSGSLGLDNPPRNPGRNPRPIATLAELFQVWLQAYDPTAPEDELAQYLAARSLYDAWRKAMHLAAHGTYRIESAEWITDKKERRYGAGIVATCSIESMIPISDEWTDTEARASLTVEELSVGVRVFVPPIPRAFDQAFDQGFS